MQRRVFALFSALLFPALVSAGGPQIKVDGKLAEFQKGQRVAVITFMGDTQLSGIATNAAGLATQAVAANGKVGALQLDQNFFTTFNDVYNKGLAAAGYDVVPAAEIAASAAYVEATDVRGGMTANAAGLKNINYLSEETLAKIAADLKADRLIYITNKCSSQEKVGLGKMMRMASGVDVKGKRSAVATVKVHGFDAAGKKLVVLEGSQESEETLGTLGGEFQEPEKLVPAVTQANQILADEVLAKLAKK